MKLPASLVILILLALHAGAATLYVDVNSPNPTPPYADLTTAAADIQDAVDAAANDDLILVNDGYYQDGFRSTGSGGLGNSEAQTNRVVIAKSLTVQSLNGPTAAYISGSGLYRCVDLTNGATLSGFTLTGGAAGYIETTTILGHTTTKTIAGDGGGVSGSLGGGVVTNCVLTGNSATSLGGGASGVTLLDCTLSGNYANTGGGAASSILIDCFVTGNNTPSTVVTEPALPPADAGGGLYGGSAINCVIANNSAAVGGGVWGAISLVNCTIVNNSASYYGGICPDTINSQIVCDANNCLVYFNNAGEYANASGCTMNYCCTFPLPAGGAGNLTNDPVFVDFWGGDYHLQSASPCINAGLNAAITNSTDLDGNPRIVGGTVDIGAYEFQESDAPTLLITSILPPTGTNQTIISWQSVNNWNYSIQRSCDLSAQSPFATLQSSVLGQAGTTSFIAADQFF